MLQKSSSASATMMGTDFLSDDLGSNRIYGDLGDDHVRGDNRLYGGAENDAIWAYHYESVTTTVRMTGGPGNDTFRSSGEGPDIVYARDGERDRINCGGGEDTVYFDKGTDAVNLLNCENRNPPVPVPPGPVID